MKQKILLLVIFVFTLNTYAQLSDSEYRDRCDIEFQSLCKLLPKKEVENWKRKSLDIDNEYIKIGNKIQQEEDTYKKINAEAIYAVQYLNSINNFLLPAKTKLVNSIADRVVKIKIEKTLSSQIDSLDLSFANYANTKKAVNFEKAYHKFLNVKSKFLNIKSERDTLFYILYETKNNVYADPYSTDLYVVFNWKTRIENLIKLKKELEEISKEVTSKQFLIVKDPNPVIPLIFQFCTLLVVISNAAMNFGFKEKLNLIIFCLVIISLMTSMILLFFSEDTFLNLVINIIVPGVSYIVYYKLQKKKKVKTSDKTSC